MKEFDYIIIGAGISGITFARLLQSYTDKTFVILEKESTPGGLCRSIEHKGNHFDTGGGHFLYSKHKKVYDFIFAHIFESNFNKFQRKTKIKIGDSLIDYPIEENLWQLDYGRQQDYLSDIFFKRSKADRNYSNSKSISVKNLFLSRFGEELCKDYFFPYNEKLWGVDFNQMSSEWAYKMPEFSEENILRSIIQRKANKENVPSHEYFYYPKKGGFQVIFDSIFKSLKQHTVTNNPIYKIKKEGDFWIVNDSFKAKKIINTAPWPVLSQILGDAELNGLRSSPITALYEPCGMSEKFHWCYIPDKNKGYHRKFLLRNYAKNKKSYSLKEFNSMNFDPFKVYPKKDTFHFHNDFAYPIPLSGKNELIERIIRKYNIIKIYGLGRWGTWQHHNSDVCILESMELFSKLEEKTL